ncbi:MAG: hypothetical protein P8X82_02770, partial [Gemmatimonadales bacterium]
REPNHCPTTTPLTNSAIDAASPAANQGMRARTIHLGFRSRPWLAAGLAASIALFVSGVVVGQWLGSRTVAESMVTAQQRTAMEAAAAVQQAGSAYVTALVALAELADTSSNGAVAQGREAALNALYAAAFELVQMVPSDPVAVTIREGLEQTRLARPQADRTGIQSVVWF